MKVLELCHFSVNLTLEFLFMRDNGKLTVLLLSLLKESANSSKSTCVMAEEKHTGMLDHKFALG